ncbi:MAG: PrsW family intramembrane metalloprotease [Propionibacteriaceae bacterium]|nr:PrsW family intramembrane metalloprotease [Propionibacteriaceae bacterium]
MIDPKAILSGQARRGVPVWVIVTISISGACAAIFLFLAMFFGIASFFMAVILALITLVPMVIAVMALDRLEPEPVPMLVMAFLWGAGSAVLVSALVEEFGAFLIVVGTSADVEWSTVVILAPVVEEICKGAVLFGILFFRRHEINGITDGVVYASMCALGFAAVENIHYYVSSWSMFATFIGRGVLSPMVHPVATAMTGIGIALSITRRGPTKFFLPVGGLILAMVLHAIWNAGTFFGVGGSLLALLIICGVMVGIILWLRAERLATIKHIGQYMTEYLPTGLVTRADLYMLSSLKSRRAARQWARSTHGVHGFNAMRDYQQACTRLTMVHDQTAAGIIDARTFIYRQGALLVLMDVARQAFLAGRAPAPHPGFPPMVPSGPTTLAPYRMPSQSPPYRHPTAPRGPQG